MGVYDKIGFEPYNSIISDANHEKQATTNAAYLICSPVLAWDGHYRFSPLKFPEKTISERWPISWEEKCDYTVRKNCSEKAPLYLFILLT